MKSHKNNNDFTKSTSKYINWEMIHHFSTLMLTSPILTRKKFKIQIVLMIQLTHLTVP